MKNMKEMCCMTSMGRMLGAAIVAAMLLTGQVSAQQAELNGKNPLIILDGTEFAGEIKDINPEIIEAISVFQDEKAVDLYGKKGTDGVVVITTKAAAKKPLVFLNETAFYGDLDSLRTNEIVSISVLKDKAAIEKYGEKAANGVILVTTKATGEKADKVSANSANPLIILNGEVYTGDINSFRPEDIEHINVLKDETAVREYGENGINGVIEITTKGGTTKPAPSPQSADN